MPSTLLEKELIEAIAKTYGTPVYVYSREEILKRISTVKYVFSSVNLFPTFACKANNNPRIIEIFKDNGFGADIVSIGEYHACKLADVDDKKIVWNGNGKTRKEIEILSKKVGYVNIDSEEEYEIWSEIDSSAEFFLRVNPDVDAKTHPHISTGLKKSKFGIQTDEIDRILSQNKLNISGFHVHIGSQITDVEPFEEAISKVVDLSKKYGFSKVNIGGGWGIKYKDKELDISDYKQRIVPYLKDFDKVIIELGRYLIAPAGLLVLKVEYVKKTRYKTFVVLDGGMNVLMRPVMYNAYHEINVLDPESSEKYTVDVVGPLCESGDIIAYERNLEIPKVGSYVIVRDVGAYGYSMSNNYNSMPRPAEVIVYEENGKYDFRLIRRREEIEEMFKTIV